MMVSMGGWTSLCRVFLSLSLSLSLSPLTCPAVSHSCSRTVRSSRYMVLDRKSMPIVAW